MTTERIEAFWRDATAADVVRMMKGETVEARFHDVGENDWAEYRNELRGCKRFADGTMRWFCREAHWAFCQVYDPPQWYVDKPEPGEGYRLLDKFPVEDLQPGDEIRALNGLWYSAVPSGAKDQRLETWYRRRIEQPKPEPKFAVGQRVRIVGPVCVGGPIYNWTREMNEHVGVVGAVRLKPTQDPEGTFYAVGEIAGWSFREDYLEAVVEPEPKHYTLQVGDTCDVPSGHRITVTEHGIEVQ